MKTTFKQILKEGATLTPKILDDKDIELMKRIIEVNVKQRELEELKIIRQEDLNRIIDI
jgi:hypothetical protein